MCLVLYGLGHPLCWYVFCCVCCGFSFGGAGLVFDDGERGGDTAKGSGMEL